MSVPKRLLVIVLEVLVGRRSVTHRTRIAHVSFRDERVVLHEAGLVLIFRDAPRLVAQSSKEFGPRSGQDEAVEPEEGPNRAPQPEPLVSLVIVEDGIDYGARYFLFATGAHGSYGWPSICWRLDGKMNPAVLSWDGRKGKS